MGYIDIYVSISVDVLGPLYIVFGPTALYQPTIRWVLGSVLKHFRDITLFNATYK